MTSLDASDVTMYVFGSMSLLAGLQGLVWPQLTLEQLGMRPMLSSERGSDDHTHVFLMMSSMAAVNMGVYYVFSAAARFRAFYDWTVPFRLLTTAVFALAALTGYAPKQVLLVACWEGLGAVSTAVALWCCRRNKKIALENVK